MIKLTEKEEFTRRILKKMELKTWLKEKEKEEKRNEDEYEHYLKLANMTDDEFQKYIEC